MFLKTPTRFFAVILLLIAIAAFTQNANAQTGKDVADSKKLFNELFHKDSLLFNAVFNTCNLKDIESVLADGYEFYPDNGGQAYTSHQTRAEFLDEIKKNFCDKNSGAPKMRREVEQETLQIFPLSENEILQTGTQHFYVLMPGQEDKLVEVSKFTRTWQKQNGDWKMAKEFDAFANTYSAHPQDSLYDTIAHMDSVLFNAYNAQDVEKIKTLFTTDLEFYHDKGGLTNYAQNMESFKTNFEKNQGIRRDLVPGSLEVYSVKDYGAMEIGSHKFCHEENGKQDCGTFKFAMVWKKTNDGWKISRVISYGH
jgi:uncharacterized protein DUF4440